MATVQVKDKLVTVEELAAAYNAASPKNTVIADSTARTITAGTSSAYSVTNLTADHVVAVWRFSGGYSENNPPGDITVTTSSGSYSITVSNLAVSGITMQPIFIKA